MTSLNPEAQPFIPLHSSCYAMLTTQCGYYSSPKYQPPLLASPPPTKFYCTPPPPTFVFPELQYYYYDTTSLELPYPDQHGYHLPQLWWSTQTKATIAPPTWPEAVAALPDSPLPPAEVVELPDGNIPPPTFKKVKNVGGTVTGAIFRKRGARASSRWMPVVKGSRGHGCEECYGGVKFAPKMRCRRKKPAGEKRSLQVFEFPKGKEEEVVSGDGGGGGKTTVMIKNIPNKYKKEMLLALLDKHCSEVNQKLRSDTVLGDGRSDAGKPIFSEFDFFYLPMDFETGCNLGYAFVNFTSPVAAWRLYRALHRRRWIVLGSRKVCEVTYARVQGLEAMKKHFENSTFICDSDDLLPSAFLPSRKGDSSCWNQSFFGNRISS